MENSDTPGNIRKYTNISQCIGYCIKPRDKHEPKELSQYGFMCTEERK